MKPLATGWFRHTIPLVFARISNMRRFGAITKVSDVESGLGSTKSLCAGICGPSPKEQEAFCRIEAFLRAAGDHMKPVPSSVGMLFLMQSPL
jgi:hypothetical protein